MATEKLFHLEKDCATGEETLREYTAEEYAQAEAISAAAQQVETERLAAEAAMQAAKESAVAKLVAVGLTEEEIAALKS